MTAMLISKSCLTEGMDIVHVSSKGQIVIPKSVREHLKFTAGSRLILIERKDAVILKKEDDDAILTPAEKRAIERARQEIREGKGISLQDLKTKLGIK